jgi:Nif-specific regulatory protein
MPGSAPLLIVTAGPARGRTVPLEGVIHIGREIDNTLPIGDPALSRRHCLVEATGSAVLIRDLASRNGVFVNGCPVTERRLGDGDQIRIGDSALLVMLPSDAVRDLESVVHDPTNAPAATMTVVPEESSYIRRDGRSELAATRAVADLQRLVALSSALQAAARVQSVYEQVLLHVAEAFAGCGAAVLTSAPGDETLTTLAVRTPVGEEMTVNHALATRALGERLALLAGEMPAIVVPLVTSELPPMVLYVGGRSGYPRFVNDDLQIAAAIGVIGALALDRAAHTEWLQGETARLREDAGITHSLVGESAAMQSVYRFIARVAPADATVLLRGESGTGKELIAHAIHANSARARGPFVPINCAALPETLLESELFGYERGAFTGAVAQQRGRLELADRGTVFLDEIGELAPALQAKLLRVLQDQIVERVGGRRGIKIDVRVIAATNLDLETALAQGTFRRDLFYRLNVVSLTVPPLRERRDDIPLLAAYFVRHHAARCKRVVRGIAPQARALLMRYDWPGNVRELSNVIERGIVLGSGDTIVREDLPEQLLEATSHDPEAHGFHGKVAASKREIIRDALDRHSGNVAAAARELDLQVTYLHRLIRNLNVRQSS